MRQDKIKYKMPKDTKITLNIAQILGKLQSSGKIGTELVEVLGLVNSRLEANQKTFIVNLNPEMLLAALKDKKLSEILLGADIAICDGVGVVWALRFLGFSKKIRLIKGRELFLDFIKLADKKSWRVFLLGGMGDEAAKTKDVLTKDYHNLTIKALPGPMLNSRAQPVLQRDSVTFIDSIKQINRFKPDLLFVAFGAPKQEIWISKNLSRLKIGGAMAVGGTFRYIAGMVPEPPRWLANLGLEWLWRLATEPRRIGRILNAVVVFPWKVFW